MCPEVHSAYSPGSSADNFASETASSSIPVSCMRTQCGSRLLCMCLDDGRYSSDATTLEGLICCDPSCLATNVDMENDFPPLSSSPPEVASSSPHSVSASSDEEGSVETLMTSSPFDISRTGLTRNSDDFPRRATHLEHPLLENEPVKPGPVRTSSSACWSTRSSPTGSVLHNSRVLNLSGSCPRIYSRSGSLDESRARFQDFSGMNTGQLDADNNASAFEGRMTKASNARPQDEVLTPSPSNVVEMPPITFGSNPENQKLSYPNNTHRTPMYRLIKRPRSNNNLHLEGPLPKKMKTTYGPISDHSRRVYAPRAASLRRAESLQTDVDSPQSTDLDINPPTPKREVTPTRLRRWRAMKKVIPYPVPIIAPPKNHVVSLPVSAEGLAIMRVKRFLGREFDQRAVEGLSADFCYAGTNAMSLLIDADALEALSMKRSLWEGALGIGRESRLKAINWLLNVKPILVERPASADSPCSVGSTISPGSSSASSVTVGSPTEMVHNLLDQLQTSQETRFHACWMFLRYFYLVMSPGTSKVPECVSSWLDGLSSDRPSKLEREGHELVTLDISVACLSLSVKYHRDFLDPLFPVYAQEYLALSPHGMSHDDLETAHRDVLSAFGYRLGVSPQPLMDELWFALPSLRQLLCFERGWSQAMDHAWTVLFRVVSEVDVQKFSISLLTTVAIMDGVIQSLVDQYRNESTTDSLCQRSGILGPITGGHLSRPISSMPSCPNFSQEQARKEAEHVLCEIQALVGVSDMHLRICRIWMEQSEES